MDVMLRVYVAIRSLRHGEIAATHAELRKQCKAGMLRSIFECDKPIHIDPQRSIVGGALAVLAGAQTRSRTQARIACVTRLGDPDPNP